MDNDSLELRIKNETINQFKSLYLKKFKHPYDETKIYTVLSSLSCILKQTQQFQILSIGFGTKSLSYDIAKENKVSVIKDMHGQMLAVRGFRKKMMSILSDPLQRSAYFDFNEKRQKYEFKIDKYAICLYSSEVFCGDCLINEESNLFSGAKPLSSFRKQNYENLKFEENILRTKPGRSDLPLSKRSLSLSCSDKIAVFNIVGIQGKSLFNLVTPIYIDKIILDGQNFKKQRILKGISFVERLSILKQKSTELIRRKIFNIVINSKQKPISRQFHINIPEITLFQKKISPQIIKEGFELCGIIADSKEEWINGKTGLPQGSSLKNYKQKGKTSEFCSNKFLKIDSDPKHFQYAAIKSRIKLLFQMWTDDFRQDNQQ